MPNTGDGPLCPLDPGHGRTLIYPGPKYLCPHHMHGGNGRMWTTKEVEEGLTLDELDTLKLYADAAASTMEGRRDLDEAVRSIARVTNTSTTNVRERISTMAETIKTTRAQAAKTKSDAAAAAAAKKVADKQAAKDAAKATKAAVVKTPRERLEHVPPETFAALRDKLGLRNKDVALAIGRSASRATELTRSLGGSRPIFDAYAHDMKVYAEEKKRTDAEAAAAAPAPKAKAAKVAKAAAVAPVTARAARAKKVAEAAPETAAAKRRRLGADSSETVEPTPITTAKSARAKKDAAPAVEPETVKPAPRRAKAKA